MVNNQKGAYEQGTYDLFTMDPTSGALQPVSRFPVYDSYLGVSGDGAR